MSRTKAQSLSRMGIDIGKNTFHVVGIDDAGNVLIRRCFTRDKLIEYLARSPQTTIGMEACPGCHWLAKKAKSFGHTPCIVPAQFVKPFVKSNKNDLIDAEAIAEAISRPTMRTVIPKTTAQLDLQALHRIRERIVSHKTAVVNQARAFLLEYGLTIHSGIAKFTHDMPSLLADEQNGLSPSMRDIVTELWQEYRALEEKLLHLRHRIESIADADGTAKRLTSIPGVGKLTATAMTAFVGNGQQFKSGRNLAAWLGLVPREYSTGGKQRLLGMSKRGNAYLRKLLIHGARTCVLHLNRTTNFLGQWIQIMEERGVHRNKVVVALANKIARIIWAVMTRPGAFYVQQRDV
ncbi:TPA: IS110 family transposase [Klebsiella pneumoniae]|nr:IS110 family transposase [Klebsiella pneumoniae]